MHGAVYCACVTKFRFHLERVAESALSLDEIALEPAQARLVRDLGALVGPKIGLDAIPCCGLWLQAVRKWQIDNQAPASAITSYSPERRLRAAYAIRDNFIELAQRVLRDDSHREALSLLVYDMFDLYMHKYNKR